MPGKKYEANVYGVVESGPYAGNVFAYDKTAIAMPALEAESKQKSYMMVGLACVAFCMLASCYGSNDSSEASILSTWVAQLKGVFGSRRPQDDPDARQYQGMNEFSTIDDSMEQA